VKERIFRVGSVTFYQSKRIRIQNSDEKRSGSEKNSLVSTTLLNIPGTKIGLWKPFYSYLFGRYYMLAEEADAQCEE
jgi:hypothetical protein